MCDYKGTKSLTLIAAQQPYFLPNFYYFAKISLSDLFIVADHLKFRKQSPIVRAKLKNVAQCKYLTIPIDHTSKIPHPPLSKIKILQGENWKRKHLRTIKSCFNNTPFFEHYYPELESIYSFKQGFLLEFLIELIQWQIGLIWPEKEFYFASKIGIESGEDIKKYLLNFNDPIWLIYPKEREYYIKSFYKYPIREINITENLSFPPEYNMELPLLFLLFYKGPETLLYFNALKDQ